MNKPRIEFDELEDTDNRTFEFYGSFIYIRVVWFERENTPDVATIRAVNWDEPYNEDNPIQFERFNLESWYNYWKKVSEAKAIDLNLITPEPIRKKNQLLGGRK